MRDLPILLLLLGLLAAPLGAFAQDDAPTSAVMTRELSPLAASFDTDRAWGFLVEQVEMGPRVPGTPGHDKIRVMIERELTAAGFSVETHTPEPVRPTLLNKEIPVYNIIGRWNTDRAERLFFSAHYDTRPVSDQADKPRDILTPVPGANDGASGVAVLLEMAHVIAKHQPGNVGIFLVFHDAEDQGVMPRQRTTHRFHEYALGSSALAEDWKAEEVFQAGVNFDMVADADLKFFPDRESIRYEPELVAEFFGIGEALWPEHFSQEKAIGIIDDHLPYLYRDLPVINLIDFDFSPWHTPADDISECSPRSLYISGTTGLELVFQRNER
ncbi:MAG: M28 family peptidase [Sumerlaeia bacterium]